MSTIVFGNMEKTCELNNSDKVYMGGGGLLLRWLIMVTLQTKNKITVILETDQIAQMTLCFLTGAYLLKAMRPLDSRSLAT